MWMYWSKKSTDERSVLLPLVCVRIPGMLTQLPCCSAEREANVYPLTLRRIREQQPKRVQVFFN